MIHFPIAPNVAADLVGLFREGLRASRVKAGESVVVYADTLSNPQYPAAFLAAAKDLGADAFQIIQPAIPHDLSKGIGRAAPTPVIVETMKRADFVVDVTTGGMLYSAEQSTILAAGTRILRVREPDDCLIRLLPSEEVRTRTKRAAERFSRAKRLRVVSEEGTDLIMDKTGRQVCTQYGMADEPGRWDHWPTGMVTTTAVEESVEGTLVIGPGSIVFPFERYVAGPITLRFTGGVAAFSEDSREAVMLRDFIEFRNDSNCRRLAHVGWGTDHRARWDILSTRGADGGGGAEARSIYGSVLLALGENRELGGRNAAPLHIDLAVRRARLELDGVPVVENGRVLDPALA
ncbi:MAG: leucyl aminopeptidase [Proteobacteria bacterium]|nr:leucyl aminopeptidase [Pseudomonadota bacterium]